MKSLTKKYQVVFEDEDVVSEFKNYSMDFPEEVDEIFDENILRGVMSFNCKSGGRSILNRFTSFKDVEVVGLDDIWIINAIGRPGNRNKDTPIIIELNLESGVPSRLFMQHGGSPYEANLPREGVSITIKQNLLVVRFKDFPAKYSKNCKAHGIFTASM